MLVYLYFIIFHYTYIYIFAISDKRTLINQQSNGIQIFIQKFVMIFLHFILTEALIFRAIQFNTNFYKRNNNEEILIKIVEEFVIYLPSFRGCQV